MANTSILKRSGMIVLDTLEIYIPTLTFAIMFIVFIINVFYRYFLNNPLTWPQEVISMTFIWTTMLGACYAQRKADHVVFSVIYDRLPARGQLTFRLISNSFIAIAFIIALKPVYDFVTFMNFQKTSVLRISFTIVYFPFLVFVVLIIGRLVYDLYKDIRILSGHGELVREEPLPLELMEDEEFLDNLDQA